MTSGSDTMKNEDERNRKIRLNDEIINSSKNKQDSIIIEPLDVRPNDTKVLEVLSEDRSNCSFRGLMRKLRMHQQTLSRSLHRLNELGLVEKSEKGYGLSEKGEQLAKVNSIKSTSAYIPLLQAHIPPNVDVSIAIANLAGRWFKNLLWLGMVQDGRAYTLQWISEDGSFQLNVRLVSNYMIIETNAIEKNKTEAMTCVYRIFEYISKLFCHNQFGCIMPNIFADSQPEN